MSEHDDLFADDAEQKKKQEYPLGLESSADLPATAGKPNQSAAKETAVQEPLGEPQLDENKVVEDIAGGGIAPGEVRAVDPPPRQATSNLPLLIALLVVILVGCAYYLMTGSTPVQVPQLETVQRKSMPVRPEIDEPVKVEVIDQKQISAVEKPVAVETVAKETAPTVEVKETEVEPAINPVGEKSEKIVPSLYQVMVGPYFTRSGAADAEDQLRALGFEAQTTRGSGIVTMIRLLEGIYPADEARSRLGGLKKKVGDAFILPEGDMRAIYVGSFHDPERAASYMETLAQKGIEVTQVLSEVEMNGKMLVALQADQETARQIAALISESGLQAQVVHK